MPISSLGGSAILVEAAVHDVFVDGTSVVNNKVAQISLAGKQDKLTAGSNVTISGNTISAVDTVYDDTALENRIAAVENKEAGWDAKQDAITDLSTIRSNAALGATAVQPAGLSGYATQAWVNSEGFLKQHQSLAAYRTAVQQDAIHDSTKQDVINDLATIRSGAALGTTSVQPIDLTNYAPKTYVDTGDTNTLAAAKTWVNSEGFLKEHQSLAAYRKSSDQDVIDAGKQKKLTAGENITITSEGVISASGGGSTYSAGNGITISDDTISAKLGEGLKFDSEGKISFDTIEIRGGQGIQFHNNTIDVKLKDNNPGLAFTSEGKLYATGGGGGEPAEYIKSANVEYTALCLTDKNDNETWYTPLNSYMIDSEGKIYESAIMPQTFNDGEGNPNTIVTMNAKKIDPDSGIISFAALNSANFNGEPVVKMELLNSSKEKTNIDIYASIWDSPLIAESFNEDRTQCTKWQLVPEKPDGGGTYILKCIDGVMQWVSE